MTINCINIKHPEYIKLKKESGLHPMILSAKVGIWQEKNGLDKFPSVSDLNNIKPGVSELFESNPELANEVYEALGFKSEDYTGIGTEDLDNLVDDNLNINWDLLDKLQEGLFSKEAKWTLKNRPEKHTGEKFTWEHIQNVVESAKKIPIPNNVDRKTLILAALLHDIGKPYRNEDHALDSVKVINRLFKDNKYSKLVKLAVRHHMISTSTTQEEYKKIIQDAKINGVKSEDFIELLLALNIADITRNRAEDTIDDYSGKSIKDTIFEEMPIKRKQLEDISRQQKQQAQQLYGSYLQTTNNPTIEGFKQWNSRQQQVSELFNENPKLANEVYEALGFNTIDKNDITYTDEEGKPCAKMGGRSSNFTKGSQWEIVKDLKGYPSHAQGGVDITLGKDGFSFKGKGGDIKAAYGLILPKIK